MGLKIHPGSLGVTAVKKVNHVKNMKTAPTSLTDYVAWSYNLDKIINVSVATNFINSLTSKVM